MLKKQIKKAERNKDQAEQAKAQLEDLRVDYDAQFTRANTEVKCQLDILTIYMVSYFDYII